MCFPILESCNNIKDAPFLSIALILFLNLFKSLNKVESDRLRLFTFWLSKVRPDNEYLSNLLVKGDCEKNSSSKINS